jgi:hypothetical protein
MYLQLIRESFTSKSTEGKIFINGEFVCYTLEDKDRFLEEGINEKVYGETAIPRGTYEVVLSKSNRFKKILPEILEVPGYTGIRIHSGNKPEDSEGCILVGLNNTKAEDNWVGSSKPALTKLMDILEQDNSGIITLEIV